MKTIYNQSMVTDYYEFTMAGCFYQAGMKDKIAYFDVFFRKNPDQSGYSIMGGLDNIIEFIKNYHFSDEDIEFLRKKNQFSEEFLQYLRNLTFTGDISAIPDGTIIFPNEPIITVKANIIEAQLIETALLVFFNHGSLITTTANRIANAAEGRMVMEFGTRRAQGFDAAIEGSKYAYIGGCGATACTYADELYHIPASGTMAHSWVQAFPSEYDAFLTYAKTYPTSSTFLVDTYNVLKSGIPNAIRVAKEYLIPAGYRLKGIRLDSGDLAYLSKQVRQMLDDAGLEDVKICVSNSLNETIIRDLLNQGSPIDSFGVGENLITAAADPVMGGVYKLAGIEENGHVIPKMKLSESIGKITNPGYKKVSRFYDNNMHYALGDVISFQDECLSQDHYTLIHPEQEWKTKELTNYHIEELQVPIFVQGVLCYEIPSIEERKARVQVQYKTLYPEITRKENPHQYYVDLSIKLLREKKNLLLMCQTEQTKEKEYQLK